MVNANIPMAGATLDTATPINQANDRQIQNELATQKVLQQHYQALDAREKSRLSSTIVGAAQLKQFLDNNDIEGAKSFLTQRRQALQTRMAHGENIDTQETDYAMQALNEGKIDELKNGVNGLMAAGQVYGILPQDNSSYLMQFKAVKQAHPGWTDAQVQDYVYGRGDPSKGTNYNPTTGQIENRPGAIPAITQREGATQFAKDTAGAAGKQVIANNTTLGNLDNLQYSIQTAEQLLPRVAATGPIMGRAGKAAEDPDYANLQGAINSITLQAKDLYNLGSGQGFTDADRDFLREVIAGQYARAETIGAGLQRMKEAMAHRQAFLQQQNQQYNQQYGGQQPQGAQGGQPTGGGQKIKVSNGQKTFLIDPADLAQAQASGFQQQQ